MSKYPYTILRCEVGSTAHGTGIDGKEDLDEMSIAVPHPDYVLGLETWEQDVIRQDKGRSLGPHERSTPDTYELTRYSLQKWAKLATAGNPSILMMLWAPIRENTQWGYYIRDAGPGLFLSRHAIHRYGGYMRAQAQRLLGTRGSGHGKRGSGQREEYIGEMGYDTKFAMHMVRLGFQGLELAETGTVQLPMHGEAGNFCRAVRRGEVPLDDVLAKAFYLHDKLSDPRLIVPFPEEADRDKINSALAAIHTEVWNA